MYLPVVPQGFEFDIGKDEFISLMVNIVVAPMSSCPVFVASPYCIEGVVAPVI